jgi:hypothetical protein
MEFPGNEQAIGIIEETVQKLKELGEYRVKFTRLERKDMVSHDGCPPEEEQHFEMVVNVWRYTD